MGGDRKRLFHPGAPRNEYGKDHLGIRPVGGGVGDGGEITVAAARIGGADERGLVLEMLMYRRRDVDREVPLKGLGDEGGEFARVYRFAIDRLMVHRSGSVRPFLTVTAASDANKTANQSKRRLQI